MTTYQSSFVEFIRNATEDEKREVYDRVMKKSTLKQRRDMGLPTGEFVLKTYGEQLTDDQISLEEMIDNAIGMTMRVCWGFDRDQ